MKNCYKKSLLVGVKPISTLELAKASTNSLRYMFPLKQAILPQGYSYNMHQMNDYIIGFDNLRFLFTKP